MTGAVVLGVDAGGTSCRTAALQLDGTCLGLGFGGSGNPTSASVPQAVEAIASSAGDAIAGLDPRSVSVVMLAAAGGGQRPPFLDALSRRLGAIGVTAPIVMAADGLAAFWSGTSSDSGYVLVSGTGAVAHRVERGEPVRTSDGLGWLLGDVGSGFWIGHRVVQAALDDLDGRGPSSALTPLLLETMRFDPADFTFDEDGRPAVVRRVGDALYEETPVRLSRFSRLAFQVPGDAVAEEILDGAAAGLAATLRAVMVPEVSGPFVVGGGLLANGTGLRERVAAALGWASTEFLPVSDGLVGAAVMALREAGVVVDDAVLASVHASVAAGRPARSA